MREIIWDAVGGIGCLMAITFPNIEQLTRLVQLIGICLGIILAVVSIRHKILEIRKIKNGGDSKKTRGEH